MGGIAVRISPETLVNQAEATGFRPDMLEKVGLLLQLLDAVRSHTFLAVTSSHCSSISASTMSIWKTLPCWRKNSAMLIWPGICGGSLGLYSM